MPRVRTATAERGSQFTEITVGEAIRCRCGSDDIVCLSPGQDRWSRQEHHALAVSDKVVLLPRKDDRRRERRATGLCVVCFYRRYGVSNAAKK